MFTLELVTLKGIKFSEDVYQINLPTKSGQIAIFPHHMPLVSLIAPGVISIRRSQSTPDKDMEMYAVTGGVIEIDNKRVRVLVDEADHSDEINAKEAEAALKEAQDMAKQAKDSHSLEEAMSQISLLKSRLKLADLRRQRLPRQK